MISSLHKDDNEAHPPVSLTNDNENWDAIKADPIFGEEGWVEVPPSVWFYLIALFDLNWLLGLIWFDLVWCGLIIGVQNIICINTH